MCACFAVFLSVSPECSSGGSITRGVSVPASYRGVSEALSLHFFIAVFFLIKQRVVNSKKIGGSCRANKTD